MGELRGVQHQCNIEVSSLSAGTSDIVSLAVDKFKNPFHGSHSMSKLEKLNLLRVVPECLSAENRRANTLREQCNAAIMASWCRK